MAPMTARGGMKPFRRRGNEDMRILSVLCGFSLAFQVAAVDSLLDTNLFAAKVTNVTALTEGPDDSRIVNLVGQILQRSHYERKPLDNAVSSEFLNQYLSALDPQHLYFLQSDIDEFESYRYKLDNKILEDGDAHPARVIFNRFRRRLDQQYDYAMELLRKDDFQFNGDERYLFNRKDQPRPNDLADAKKLWRDRLRHEYLQEKLVMGKPDEIAGIVLEKLKASQPEGIAESLKEKQGKERIAEIDALVKSTQKKEGATPETTADAVRNFLAGSNAKEIIKVLSRRYTRVLRSLNEYDNGDVLQLYLTSLAHVYDPHSDYMGKAALENFSIGMKLSLFGIGALLRSEDGFCKIVSLTPNGPAEKSKKLKPNDRIIAVAQGEEEAVDVVETKLSKVVDMIRGAKGTEVRLTVIPADAPDPSVRKVISLIRDEVKLEDQEAKAKIFELPGQDGKTQRLGLIDLPSFYASFDLEVGQQGGKPRSTTSDVTKLIKKLQEEKVEGIILDLRRNGGGSLEEAINLTGLFIKDGPVVQVKDPSGQVFVETDPDPTMFYDGPLIVLTSRFSASASEILAGALQDYGRALIVGDTSTHGKGTVQSLIQLGPILRQRGSASEDNPGAIKITIRKFYRASGGSTQLKGVEPDIVLPSVNNHADVGESSLDNAMEWDNIPQAEFEKLDRVTPFLAELKTNSQTRVEKSSDYDFLRSEIERYKELLADKSVSMNEATRLQEKKAADARLQSRKKELAQRPKTLGKVYEITLKDVDKPGLPDPNLAKTEEPTTSTGDDLDADGDGEDKLPAVDISLEETKHILNDFIELTGKGGALTASKPAVKSAPVEN